MSSKLKSIMICNIKVLAIAAALICIAAIAGASAYFTSTDSMTNTFTVGEVKIDLTEPAWEEVKAVDLVQGHDIPKDPKISNTGSNSLYAFIKVSVPKRDIYTYDPETLARNPKAVTELFILPTPNTGWTLLSTDGSSESITDYLYAYGTTSTLRKLEPGESTNSVFETVRYCYAVEGQGLDEDSHNILVKAYAIQADNIGSNDAGASDPEAVWTVLTNEAGQ